MNRKYFEELFQAQQSEYAPVISMVGRRLTEEDNNMLLAPFTREEFKKAIFQMHLDKAHGPDGLNPAF